MMAYFRMDDDEVRRGGSPVSQERRESTGAELCKGMSLVTCIAYHRLEATRYARHHPVVIDGMIDDG
jgi:hypothetical protein